MGQILPVNHKGIPVYSIHIEDSFETLHTLFANKDLSKRKLCIVTDSNVSRYHLPIVKEHLERIAAQVDVFVFEAGEENKTLDTVKNLYEHLILSGYDRSDVLVALGGGVVGDLTGFAAATYLRGIDFYQIPTSLLSMVDSSIGGKTGVDFSAYKNMVGAFHQPQGVFINVGALDTLSDKLFYSGFGEIIKHGLIKNKGYYEWLKANKEEILSRNTELLKETIYQSCLIKKHVVDVDFKESGERALLNFGHTLGHAIEKLMDFTMLHGECVGVGMVAALYLSYEKKRITEEELRDAVKLIEEYHLPICVDKLVAEDILAVSKSDKKMNAGKINFILLDEIGKAVMDSEVTDEEILQALTYVTC